MALRKYIYVFSSRAIIVVRYSPDLLLRAFVASPMYEAHRSSCYHVCMKNEADTQVTGEVASQNLCAHLAALPEAVKKALERPTRPRMVDPKLLERHPVSAEFPDLPATGTSTLAADMKLNGQREPALLFEGKVADGWQRRCAGIEAGLELRCVDLPKEAGPYLHEVVRSLNTHRRHLSQGQLAVLAAREADPLVEEGIKARGANLKQNSARAGEPQSDEKNSTIPGTTAARVAGRYDISGSYVNQARRLQREHPELADRVLAGALTLTMAMKMANGSVSEAPRPCEDPPTAERLRLIERESLQQLDAFRPQSADVIMTKLVRGAANAESESNGIDPAQLDSLARVSSKAIKPGGLLLVAFDIRDSQEVDALVGHHGFERKFYFFAGFSDKGHPLISATYLFYVLYKPSPRSKGPALTEQTTQQLADFGDTPMLIAGREVEIWQKLTAWFTHPEDKIVIPFAGRSSAAEACLQLGRECWAIEAEPTSIKKLKGLVPSQVVSK